jgi:hypothetical protein
MRGSASKRLEELLYRSGGTIKKRRMWLEKLFQELNQKKYRGVMISTYSSGFYITLDTKSGDRAKIDIKNKGKMVFIVSDGKTQARGKTKRIQDILDVMK